MNPHNIIGLALGTRLQRIERMSHGWRLWLATSDYKHGTYLLMGDNGAVVRTTVRVDEGDDSISVRPSDAVVELIHRYESKDKGNG